MLCTHLLNAMWATIVNVLVLHRLVQSVFTFSFKLSYLRHLWVPITHKLRNLSWCSTKILFWRLVKFSRLDISFKTAIFILFLNFHGFVSAFIFYIYFINVFRFLLVVDTFIEGGGIGGNRFQINPSKKKRGEKGGFRLPMHGWRIKIWSSEVIHCFSSPSFHNPQYTQILYAPKWCNLSAGNVENP